MAKAHVAVSGRFYLLAPGSAAIVTAHWQGKDNAMAAAWHSTLSVSPPLFGVSIAPTRYTCSQILASREFGVNFVSQDFAEMVSSVGGSSGRTVDKFQQFKIGRDKPIATSAPVLRDAYCAFECVLVDNRAYGDHVWLVGEIVAAHYLEEAFTPEGAIDLEKVSPALYLGGDSYIDLDKAKHAVSRYDRRVYGKK